MNKDTIEALQACISRLNHIKGAVVLTIDNSNAQGKVFYKCQLKVPLGKEYLLKLLESLSKQIGNLNGEGLGSEINIERRILFLS